MNIQEDVMGIAQQFLRGVRRSGSDNVMALCPFHRKIDGSFEQHPSFAMNLTNGLYFCHSCQEKGNLYTFLRDIGVDRQVIENGYQHIIDRVKRSLPATPDPTKPNVISLSPIPEGLLGLFETMPLDLINSGFKEETLKRFDIGFDRWHMRITFPLRDLEGKLAGISGRDVRGYWPKYKVYDEEYKAWDIPARIGWDKRTILWNAHTIYPQAYFNTDPIELVVVEGFKACMWLHQVGITNTVALLGTYLSWEQKWIIERMGATVYLFGDNNDPGYRGTAKTGENLKHSLVVKVMEYPDRLIDDDDAQPDDLTPEEVMQAKEEAIDFAIWMDKNRSYLQSLGIRGNENGLR